jgi:hypothetical protein
VPLGRRAKSERQALRVLQAMTVILERRERSDQLARRGRRDRKARRANQVLTEVSSARWGSSRES